MLNRDSQCHQAHQEDSTNNTYYVPVLSPIQLQPPTEARRSVRPTRKQTLENKRISSTKVRMRAITVPIVLGHVGEYPIIHRPHIFFPIIFSMIVFPVSGTKYPVSDTLNAYCYLGRHKSISVLKESMLGVETFYSRHKYQAVYCAIFSRVIFREGVLSKEE